MIHKINVVGEKLVENLMISFFEDPSFKCARRIWLTCHHFNVDVPQEVFEVFIKQLESDDEAWDMPEPKGVKSFKALKFISEQMSSGTSRHKILEKYDLILAEKQGEEKSPSADSIQRNLKRFSKWLKKNS